MHLMCLPVIVKVPGRRDHGGFINKGSREPSDYFLFIVYK